MAADLTAELEALRTQNRQLTAMLDALPDYYIVQHADGTLLFLNRGAREATMALAGLPPEQVLGRKFQELDMPSSVREQIRRDVERALRGETVREELFQPTAQGDRWREHILAPISDDLGRVEAVAVANRDIHARKMAEEELAQAVMFRERVMGMLSHDLRNPLSAILGLVGLLQLQEGIPDGVRDGLRRMHQSAQRMNEMIGTILDVTRLRYRGAPLTPESVDLAELARAIVDELRIANPGRHIEVRAQGELRGRWDPGRMGQVISNLVGNALTHGDREAAVEVRLSSEDGGVSLAVSNRGPTIPHALLPQLFEPFRQGDRPRARESGGLGLGLFIARSLVTAHGGEIEVASREGLTTFTVRLPRETGAKDDG